MKKHLLQLALGISLAAGFAMVSYAGEWKQDSVGYKYLDNGRYVQSAWLRTPHDGSWYHFDSRGYMETGWLLDGKWYYLDAVNGYLYTNRWVGNYYLGSDGAMLTSTTTPDGYYVGVDGAWTGSPRSNSMTSTNLTERQKYLMKEAAENYINTFGTGKFLKSTYQLNDDEIILYMGTLIHNNDALLTREMKEVQYRQDGREVTEANPISEVVNYTESFLGRKVPGNFKDRLYNYDFGVSDTHIAMVRADGEGYHTAEFQEYSNYEEKLLAKGKYYDYDSGGVILSGGDIVAVFKENENSMMGMSLDFITLIKK